ncbi:MAG: prepilin-type N-terminal cleavage/methylation domain-containing protein [Phycisphaeraceae bacterium]|nr:prepilin-type N-terminal cleavage/methylation domain-containing protein [Phycisphaeraceae bacterium]
MAVKAPPGRGFSLVELVIVVVIIGIIGAIAAPRLSGQAERAKESAVIGTWQAVTKAVDFYAAEHDGLSPAHSARSTVDTSGTNFVARLVQTTDSDGKSPGMFGPYLRDLPANPINRRRTVRINGAAAGANTHGWRFDSTTLEFLPDHSTVDELVAGGKLGGKGDLVVK